jgi:hypothetical protein
MKVNKWHIHSGQNQTIQSKAQNQASEHAILQFYKLKNTSSASNGAITQLATKITPGGTEDFKLGGVSVGKVGKSMEAELDPGSPVVGSNTSGAVDLDPVMNQLPNSTTWKRGHLLNHDLGGAAILENLFPISTAANNEHKIEVENPVKHWLNKGCEIDYDITAHQKDDQTADGHFECDAEITNSPVDSNERTGKKISKTIHSHANEVTSNKLYRDNSLDTGFRAESRDSHASVDHKPENEVYRNDYASGAQAREGWKHTTHTDYLSNLPKKKLKPEAPEGIIAVPDEVATFDEKPPDDGLGALVGHIPTTNPKKRERT